MEVPYNKEQLEEMSKKATKFAAACYESDSLFRGLAWSSLIYSIQQVMEEEKFAGYVFPSICNPNTTKS